MIYFPSTLEYKAWQAYSDVFDIVIPQYTVKLLEPAYNAPAVTWKADLYIPIKRLIVEVKGKWILSGSNRAEKDLFKLKMNLLSRLPLNFQIVSDSEFNISNYQVINYHDHIRTLR